VLIQVHANLLRPVKVSIHVLMDAIQQTYRMNPLRLSNFGAALNLRSAMFIFVRAGDLWP